MSLRLCGLFALFAAVLATAPSASADSRPFESILPGVEIVQPATDMSAEPAAAFAREPQQPSTAGQDAMSAVFYRAMALIISGKHGEAATRLRELRISGLERGIRNLPHFAMELLSRAQTMAKEKKYEEAQFLLTHALELAPEDPRVWFGASSLFDLTGYVTAVRNWMRGASLITRSPVLAGGVAAGILLVVLFATTIGLLVVSVLNVTRAAEPLFDRVARFFSYRYRAIGAALTLLGLLILPISAGLLPALAVWTVLVAGAVRGMRTFAVLSGLLMIMWGLALPTIVTVLLAVRSSVPLEIERIQTSSASPTARPVLEQALTIRPGDPLLLFTLGNIAWTENRITDAYKLYEAARERAAADQGVRNAVDVSYGAALLRLGRNDDAAQVLSGIESRGAVSYELYNNLSLVALASLDTGAAESYAMKALALRPRSAAVSSGVGQPAAPQPLITQAPAGSLVAVLFWHPGAMGDRERARRIASAAHSMLFRGSPELLVGLGVLTLLTAALVGRRRAAIVMAAPPPPARSRIWSLFPGGRLVMAGRPAAGLFVLVGVLSLASLALEGPITVPSASYLPVPDQLPLLVAAAVLFVAGTLWPLGWMDDGDMSANGGV